MDKGLGACLGVQDNHTTQAYVLNIPYNSFDSHMYTFALGEENLFLL